MRTIAENGQRSSGDRASRWTFPVLFLSPESFFNSPQIGEQRTVNLIDCLSQPIRGDAKGMAGGYSPVKYKSINSFAVRRKRAIVDISAIVIDADKGGDVDTVAELVAPYSAIVHETFSSTDHDPRCRVLFLLKETIDVVTHDLLHSVVRAHLRAAGVIADEGAKDASRVSYWPVRRPGAGYRWRVVDGAPLDAHAVLAAQPPPPPRPVAQAVSLEHRDGYVRGALRKAAEAVGSACAGERHYLLCKEAYALARLGLSSSEIESALVPAFIAAAGERRRHEALRTVRDAIRAKRGA